MKRRERNGFAFYLQILILLMVFLGVCTILLETFAGASVLSRRARRQNDGAVLCRNAAEAFAASGTLDGTLGILDADHTQKTASAAESAELKYNASLQLDADGCYTLTLRLKTEETPAGSLVHAYFCVTDENGEACASLDTEKYLPDAQRGGGADAA
jgi:type II secretory pathway pseudopilin PulG